MIGRDDAKLAAMLCAIEPSLSGFIVVGGCGVGKSSVLSKLRDITDDMVVRIPINADEERLKGGLDFESAVKGIRQQSKGLLDEAKDGFLLIEGISKTTESTLGYIFSKKDSGDKFRIAASWHPDDGELSAHYVDRIDLCVVLESIPDEQTRRKIVADNISQSNDGALINMDKNAVQKAKKLLPEVELPSEAIQKAIELTIEANADGHRGEIAVILAARAYAALLGDTTVDDRHIKKIANLALVHRQRELPPPPPEDENEEEQENNQNTQNNSNNEQQDQNQDSNNSDTEQSDDNSDEGNNTREGVGKEDVIRADNPLKLKKMLFDKDKLSRNILGRRTATDTKVKRGRTVKTLGGFSNDISIPATIRSAAPWQRSRGRKAEETLIIDDADIQSRKREAKTVHTMVMLLDISGSMGVQARIKEAKSACLGFLKDAYIKREDVAVIAFRGNEAQCVVAPTRAGATVSETLNALPTGGKTPLAAGLKEAYFLIKKIRQKDTARRITCVIMTDAKANSGADDGEKPWDSAKKWANTLVDIKNVDWVVVDTEGDGFVKLGKAQELAGILGARCIDFDAFKSDGMNFLSKT